MRYRASWIATSLLAGLILANPAWAGGFLGELVRPFDPQAAKAIDDAHRQLGEAFEHAAAPATAADIKMLMHDLSSKSEEDLLSLSFSLDLCSEIDCHNVPLQIVGRLVRSTLDRNQAMVDLDVRKAQAVAAIASASISLISLALSIISLRRTGRPSVKQVVEQQTVTPEASVAGVGRNSLEL
jgi:hypothetical protein